MFALSTHPTARACCVVLCIGDGRYLLGAVRVKPVYVREDHGGTEGTGEGRRRQAPLAQVNEIKLNQPTARLRLLRMRWARRPHQGVPFRGNEKTQVVEVVRLWRDTAGERKEGRTLEQSASNGVGAWRAWDGCHFGSGWNAACVSRCFESCCFRVVAGLTFA